MAVKVKRESDLPLRTELLLIAVLIAGLALIGFSSFLAYRDGFENGLAIPFIVGALIFGASFVGLTLADSISLKKGDAEFRIGHPSESGPPSKASNPQEDNPPAEAAPPVTQDPTTVTASVEAAKKEPTTNSSFREAIDAYISDDFGEFDKKMREYAAEQTDPGVRLNYEVLRIEWLLDAGQAYRLSELERFTDENPTVPRAISVLGDAYLSLDKIDDALKQYRRGLALEGVDEEWELNFLRGVADAFIRAGELDGAIGEIKQYENRRTTPEWQSRVNQILAHIFEARGDVRRKHYHLELALDAKPGDASLRFTLAHSYSNADERSLAMYHYAILVKQRGDSAELNNLAVAMDAIELPVHAARHYRSAIAKGSSLAGSNLAKTMINAGLIDEARSLLEDALKMEDPHENVHETMAMTKTTPEAEDERWKKVQESSRIEHEFFLESMRSSAATLLDADVVGDWRLPSGKLMKFVKKDDEMTAAYKTEKVGWDWTLSGQIDHKQRTFSFDWDTDYFQSNKKGRGTILFRNGSLVGVLHDSPELGMVTRLEATRVPPGSV